MALDCSAGVSAAGLCTEPFDVLVADVNDLTAVMLERDGDLHTEIMSSNIRRTFVRAQQSNANKVHRVAVNL